MDIAVYFTQIQDVSMSMVDTECSTVLASKHLMKLFIIRGTGRNGTLNIPVVFQGIFIPQFLLVAQ